MFIDTFIRFSLCFCCALSVIIWVRSLVPLLFLQQTKRKKNSHALNIEFIRKSSWPNDLKVLFHFCTFCYRKEKRKYHIMPNYTVTYKWLQMKVTFLFAGLKLKTQSEWILWTWWYILNAEHEQTTIIIYWHGRKSNRH